MKNKFYYYPNISNHLELVLYNKKEDKILQENINKPPKIYGVRAEARRDTKFHKGYSVVDVQDLPDHQQEYLIKQWNHNLKYIK